MPCKPVAVGWKSLSLCPKKPGHVAINIYNICKGHFGSRGGKYLKTK